MIKSLKILNFQSHDKSNLQFSDGVNVIVGSSDSGKTAIIRALRWVSKNKPSGNSICSNWGGATNVILETEEGFVRRLKDKTDQYELLIHGNNNLVFKAFGTNVPQEIVTFLNVNDINLQSQFDSSFLISNSPGEVAGHFNKVARLDKIDTGLQNVQREIRNLTQTIATTEDVVTNSEKELTIFEYLPQFEAEVEVLEEMVERQRAIYQQIRTLQAEITKLEQFEQRIDEASELLVLDEAVCGVLTMHQQKHEVQESIDTIQEDIHSIERTLSLIQKYSKLLTLEESVIAVLALYEDDRQNTAKYENLDGICSSIDLLQTKLKTNQRNLIDLEKQFADNMPDICPLCDQPIKKK